jgi:diguanylate cyclase (GGDEF)-like protein/PAS domain S-box-containing protein
MHKEPLFIVPDASRDPRFSNTAWVTSEPHIRFYAGASMVTREGHALGTVCVLDRVPRELNSIQKEALRALARQAVAHVEISHQVAALQESETRFKGFMNNSPVLATLKSEEGRYIYVNQPFLKKANLKLSDVIGKNDFELWPEEMAARLRDRDLRLLTDGNSVSEIEVTTSRDGQKRYWQVSKFLLQGDRKLLGGMGLDITQSKQYEQQLMQTQNDLKKALAKMEVLSVTDGLTDLYNRRAFEEKLKDEFERARRYNSPLSLLMLDADNFKEFNDLLGHPAGDDLLQSIARMLKDNARANDVTARYGGDEFAVILPNTDSKVAYHLAERLRWAARELCYDPHQVTISIGVAALSLDMSDHRALVVAADSALYDAKRKGRNQVSNIVFSK